MTRQQRRRPAPLLVRAALCTALLPTAAVAQDITKISSTPSCRTCRIELTRLAVLDQSGDGALAEMPNRAILDARGRIYLTSHADPIPPVFDTTGRFLRRLGPRGGGPGEFREVDHLAATSSGLVALDADRLVRLDADLRAVSSVRPGAIFHGIDDMLPLADGRLLISGITSMQDPLTERLHLLDSAGTVVSSMVRPAQTGPRGRLNFLLASSTEPATFWSAQRSRYLLELRALDGRVVRALELTPSWFEPERSPGNPGPLPRVRALRAHASGALWTGLWTRSADWQRHEVKPQPGREMRASDIDWDGLYDSVIEVVDPAAGTLLASRRIPQLLLGFLDDQRALLYSNQSDGSFALEIWRVQLVR